MSTSEREHHKRPQVQARSAAGEVLLRCCAFASLLGRVTFVILTLISRFPCQCGGDCCLHHPHRTCRRHLHDDDGDGDDGDDGDDDGDDVMMMMMMTMSSAAAAAGHHHPPATNTA